MTIEAKMNPNIKKAEVGLREIREVKLYPLSVADQFKTTAVIKETTKEIDFETATNQEIASSIVDIIQDKLDEIIKLVTDPQDTFTLEEIDAVQLTDIVNKIYEANFEGAVKNVKSLFDKIKESFQLKRSSQPSAKDTLAIDSKTSTESPISKEDQQ